MANNVEWGSAADWVSVVATVLLGVIGFILARNIKRDLALKVVEQRLTAYTSLWEATSPARMSGAPPLSEARKKLRKSLSDWYFEKGNGMVLSPLSQQMYLHARDNLDVPVVKLEPGVARKRLQALAGKVGPDAQVAGGVDPATLVPPTLDEELGRLAQRQLSLLRTQLKDDLGVYGANYGAELDQEDREFLRICGANPERAPWRDSKTRHFRRRGNEG